MSHIQRYILPLIKQRFLVWHIEGWTKWLPFCRQYFKCSSFNENHIILSQISLRLVPDRPTDKSALVQSMAWHLWGEKAIHDVNQCWFIVNWTLKTKLQWNLNKNIKSFFKKKKKKKKNAFIDIFCRIVPISFKPLSATVETLYSTIYYSKYFIELNFDKSTQYVALWTHKRHPIPRPFRRAMECLLWVFQQKLTVL